VRRAPNAPPEAPYDVTAWSLGMLFGVDTTFAKNPLPDSVTLTRITDRPTIGGDVAGTGARFTFDYKGPDTALAINRLLKDGARVAFEGPSRVAVTGIARGKIEQAAKEFGLHVKAASPESRVARPTESQIPNPECRSTLPVSPCTSRGLGETWTKGGRAGCSSSTSST